MSDPVTKRRPMIDLEEFEKRLRLARSTTPEDGDSLAEFARLVGWQDNSSDTIIESRDQRATAPRQDESVSCERKERDAQLRLDSGDFAAIEAGLLNARREKAELPPEAVPSPAGELKAEKLLAEHRASDAQERLISGDFAAIEAGLLGARREHSATMPGEALEAENSNVLAAVIDETDRLRHEDVTAVGHRRGVIGQKMRSRRSLYATAAIAIVAIGGVAAIFGFRSGVFDTLQIATIKAGDEAAKLSPETTRDVEASVEPRATQPLGSEDAAGLDIPGKSVAKDASVLGVAPQPPSGELNNNAEQQAGAQQAQETPPGAVGLDGPAPRLADGFAAETSAAASPVPEQAAPLGGAASIEPKQKDNMSNPPDGVPLSHDAPATATLAPLPAPRPSAAAKVLAPKTARVAAKPDPAAVQQGGGSHSAQAAKAAKAATKPIASAPRPRAVTSAPVAKPAAAAATTKPVQPSTHGKLLAAPAPVAKPPVAVNADPAQASETKTVRPAPEPGPATNGPLGIVQNAVNSLTSSTAKLLGLGAN